MDKVDQKYLNELSLGSEASARNAYNVAVKDAGMKEEDMPVRLFILPGRFTLKQLTVVSRFSSRSPSFC